jgi:hypothetical protein
MTTPQPQGPGQPFKPTTARWLNRKRRVPNRSRGGGEPSYTEKWSKVLAHTGPYTQFKYGTDTPSTWPARGSRDDGPLQKCLINSWQSAAITVDVDDEQQFLETRTGRLIGRAQAWTAHGAGYHVVIDARGVPEADWPRQGPIAGADIKSNGFVPLPGCMHWDGEPYRPVYQPGPVAWWPGLIAAICADLAGHRERQRQAGGGGGGGGGGDGGGHDGEIFSAVLSMVLRGLARGQCYAEWLTIAVPRDPSYPFTDGDFDRHYRSAVRTAEQIRADEREGLQEAASWLAGQCPAPATAGRRVARRTRTDPALLGTAARWLAGGGT